MRDALICNPLRTPIGRYGGIFRDTSATHLATTVLQRLMADTGFTGAETDDIILGQCYPNGEAPAIGRVAALDAGMTIETPGMQLDRRCGSGLQAICQAAMMVQTGVADIVIAGGVESMSQAEFYVTDIRWGATKHDLALQDRLGRGRVTAGGRNYPVPGGMLETAENVRERYGISREEQDQLAVKSHERAVAAQDEGRFDEEIVTTVVTGRKGTVEHRADEHPRPGTNMDSLAKLRPVRESEDPESTVTAGNASGQNDAASMCIVASPEAADRHGLRAMGALRAWAIGGVHPAYMGMGPVPATAKALERAGKELKDLDLIELNEAFAAQVLGVTREWNLGEADFERLNVNGSGISLGHPVGATGCRIMTTMLYEMHRQDADWALETMCIGGGQGLAAIVERVA